MSFTAARQALAEALDSLPFLTGSQFRPATLKPGVAYPLFDEVLAGPGHAYGGQWRVIVILGATEKGAQQNLDDWVPTIIDTLLPVAVVDRCRAFPVPIERGEIYAVEITVRSE